MKTQSDGYSHFRKLEVTGDVMEAGNGLQLTPGATGAASTITAVGDDTNVGITLTPKGTGQVSLGGDGAPKYAEVAVSSAELLDLADTPKELVAAPGAGKALIFHHAVLLLDATATAYAESADNLVIKYENEAGDSVSQVIEMTNFIDQTTDQMTVALPVIDPIVAKAVAENKALVLVNPDGDFTTGTGVLRVKVFYSVITTGW